MTDIALKLDDLNNYTLLDIFDIFTLGDLISVADMSSRFRELIIKHYAVNRYRIHEKIIEVGEKLHRINSKEKIDDGPVIMRILDPHIALAFLRNFGSIITRIHIREPGIQLEKIWTRRINTYINEYCSESLTDLHMHTVIDTIDEWRKPFKRLSKLSLQEEPLNYDKIANLNEILPSLQYLDMEHSKFTSLKLFEHHFPHLENIAFHVFAKHQQNITLYEKFFQLNPQIRSIEVIGINNINLFRLLSEQLTNIENFVFLVDFVNFVKTIGASDGIIHFKSVKKCKIFDFYLSSQNPFPVMFDNLEELEVRNLLQNENTIQFITQHRNLKVLKLSSGTFTLDQWMLMLTNFPNLEEIHKNWDSPINDDPIFALMTAESKLKKFVMAGMIDHRNIPSKLINSEWRIQNDMPGFFTTFIREDNDS